MTDVAITDDEFNACKEYVEVVQWRSNRYGYNHANARGRSPEQRMWDDVNGHCGEIAFCRYLGRCWIPDINAFHAQPDLMGVFEIRTTHWATGRLIIRDDEHDAGNRCFILVTGNAWEPPRVMSIRGYIWGGNAQQPEFLDDPHGHRESWFVPQEALHPLDDEVRARMIAYIERPQRRKECNGNLTVWRTTTG